MGLYIRKINGHEQTRNIPFSDEFVRQISKSAIAGEIALIQADGDELEHIISRFPNLPYTLRICHWRGELARFIGENLTA